MKGIEELVEVYHEEAKGKFEIFLRVLGVLLLFIGALCLLWMIPDGLVKSWMGDREYANWATIFCMGVLFYYGSESFSLTFGGGAFLLLTLLGANLLVKWELMEFSTLAIIISISGWVLLLIARLISGSIRNAHRDILFIPLHPVWLLRFIYRAIGIQF